MANTFDDKSIASKAGKLSKRGKSLKTKQWEALGDSIMGAHTDKFNEELGKLSGKDFINAYTQVLEYFQPKLQRSIVDLSNEDGSLKPLTGITFIDAPKK